MLALLLVATALLGAALWRLMRSVRLLHPGMVMLVGLGLFLASLGMLIDADVLPKPAGIEWKAHLEEPLEAIGALCLALTALESAIAAIVQPAGRGRVVPFPRPAGRAGASGFRRRPSALRLGPASDAPGMPPDPCGA